MSDSKRCGKDGRPGCDGCEGDCNEPMAVALDGPLTIDSLVAEAFATAFEKGWWENVESPEQRIPEALALVHSEVSEALEEYRRDTMEYRERADGKPEGFGVELADAIIRIADLAGALDVDLTYCLRRKLAFNKTRPRRHGGKKA